MLFFSDFSSSGLRLFNNFNITLKNVSILNCTHLTEDNFSENSALSIVYQSSGRKLSYVQIVNSWFYYNAVRIVELESASEAIIGARYPGRGGALGVFINEPIENTAIKIFISKCSFTYNKATYGGAIYLHSNQLSSGHNFTVIESAFDHNYAAIAGGGIDQASTKIGNISANTIFTPSHYYLADCNFTGNIAQFGGAVNFVAAFNRRETTDTVYVDNCIFNGNIGIVLGAAIMISALSYPHVAEQDVPYTISNWYFISCVGYFINVCLTFQFIYEQPESTGYTWNYI